MSLSTMKKAELKALCESNGIFLTGKELRPDLIELLTSNGVVVSRKKSVVSDAESESEAVTPRTPRRRARKPKVSVKANFSDIAKKLYSLTIGPTVSFAIRKNNWILATLSYPQALVKLQIALELILMLSKFVTVIELGYVLPIDGLPPFVSALPVANPSFLSSSLFWAPIFIWSVATVIIPYLAAFYVNYTVYTFDPVIITATRALLAYAVLEVKADSISSLKSELLSFFGVSGVACLQHFTLTGILQYGSIFGKLSLVVSIFTTVVNIYGSLTLLLD